MTPPGKQDVPKAPNVVAVSQQQAAGPPDPMGANPAQRGRVMKAAFGKTK